MGMAGPVWWIGFHVVVAGLLALDLFVLHKDAHAVRAREAALWSGIFAALSLAFAGLIGHSWGQERALEFVAAYVIELSLSVDNLFVFLLLFTSFKVKDEHQHRVLFWGVMGAIVMRATLIIAGAALVARFSVVLVFFGVILLFTGGKLLFSKNDDDMPATEGRIVKLVRRFIPITEKETGGAFFVIEDGKRKATMLFLVLVTVEISDLVFAVDSIPAVFGVARDPFLIYTSNICAILGLRSLYFLLAAMFRLLRFLKPALAIVLLFVGGKLIGTHWGVHIDIGLSLGIIGGVLGVGVIASLLFAPKAPAGPPATPAAHGSAVVDERTG